MADYNLPTDLNTSSTLDQSMPAIYAQNVGIQQQQQQDNMAQLQQAYAADQQFQAQKRPLDLNELVARTNQTTANAGYMSALARGSNLSSDEKQATMPGTIAATDAKNSADSVGSRADMLSNHARVAGLAAAQMDALPQNTPPAIRAQVLRNVMGPLMPDGAETFLSQMDPSDLSSKLRQVATDSYQQSAAARSEVQKTGSAMDIAKVDVQGRTDVANIGANARLRVADMTHGLQFQLNQAEMSKNYAAQSGAAQKLEQLEVQQGQEAAQAGNQDEANMHFANARFYGQKSDAALKMDLQVKAAAAGTPKAGSLGTADFLGQKPASNAGGLTPPIAPVPPGTPGVLPASGTPQQGSIPAAHSTYLMAHANDPKVVSDFNAKYGPGSAEALIGGTQAPIPPPQGLPIVPTPSPGPTGALVPPVIPPQQAPAAPVQLRPTTTVNDPMAAQMAQESSEMNKGARMQFSPAVQQYIRNKKLISDQEASDGNSAYLQRQREQSRFQR